MENFKKKLRRVSVGYSDTEFGVKVSISGWTFWGETWGSVGCLGWAGRCSSYRWAGASGHGWRDCWGVGRDWFVWSADSRLHLSTTSDPGRSAGFPGWLAQDRTLPPSPGESWKSSRPRPAGWCNLSLFALGRREKKVGGLFAETLTHFMAVDPSVWR